MMKTALKISLALNFGLVAMLMFSWHHHLAASFTTPRHVPPKSEPTVGKVQEIKLSQPPLAQQPFGPESFHWHQLESDDYRTYVKNLRAIGCPELSLRAIVTADVEAAYRERGDELERKLTEFDHSSWSEKLRLYSARQTWLAELQKLSGEKDSEIASLLGSPLNVSGAALAKADSMSLTNTVSSVQTSMNDLASSGQSQSVNATQFARAISSAASASLLDQDAGAVPLQNYRNRHQDAQPTPVMPLVFRKVDLSQLNLNAQQIQGISDLRQQFIEEVGGLNQNPYDPNYLERWLKAQTDVDAILHGMLGTYAWETYQVATWNP